MTDPATCPACGGQNQCAIATARAGPCWCFTSTIPAEALAAVPEAQRNIACLCPGCAGGGTSEPTRPAEAADAD